MSMESISFLLFKRTLAHIFVKLVDSIDDKIFSKDRIEDFVISEADFVKIIEEEQFFGDIEELDKNLSDKIEAFLTYDPRASLAVQKMITLRYDDPTFTMDEIQDEFCNNLVEYLGDDFGNNSRITPAIFRVLQKGCLDILNIAINKGDLWAHDQKQVFFIKNTLSEISHDINRNGDKTRRDLEKIVREEGKKTREWIDRKPISPLGGRDTIEEFHSRLLRLLQPIDFHSEIKRYTNNFYGREWLFPEIDRWLEHKPNSRVFWLSGNPLWVGYVSRNQVF